MPIKIDLAAELQTALTDPVVSAVLTAYIKQAVKDALAERALIPINIVLSAQPVSELTYTRKTKQLSYQRVPEAFALIEVHGRRRIPLRTPTLVVRTPTLALRDRDLLQVCFLACSVPSGQSAARSSRSEETQGPDMVHLSCEAINLCKIYYIIL